MISSKQTINLSPISPINQPNTESVTNDNRRGEGRGRRAIVNAALINRNDDVIKSRSLITCMETVNETIESIRVNGAARESDVFAIQSGHAAGCQPSVERSDAVAMATCSNAW